MKLLIPVSHRDSLNARRMLGWLGFMARESEFSLRGESVLIVISQLAARMQHADPIARLASLIFGDAAVFVPETSYERGWPRSPNFMFRQGLECVEKNFPDDVLMVEPDCVPTRPEWFHDLRVEFERGGKPFMGASVPAPVHHASGVGCYGREWRRFAPRIAQCDDTGEGWDTFAANEIVPRCHFTPMVQHIFHNPGMHPGIFSRDCRLFHQCKTEAGFRLRDAALYDGRCATDPLFTYDLGDIPMPNKFYVCANASRPFEARGYTFRFDQLYLHGGAWVGGYYSGDEGVIQALEELCRDPRRGVEEVDQATYEKQAKKKIPTQHLLPNSQPSARSSTQVSLLGAGADVAEGSPFPSPDQEFAKQVAKADKADDVLKIGTVQTLGTKLPRGGGPKNWASVPTAV